MNKFQTVAIALMFLAAKVEGVEASAELIDIKPKNTEIVQTNTDPVVLAKAIMVDPYDYSNQKQAEIQLKDYQKVVAEENRIKEEARKAELAKKQAEQAKAVAAVAKADTRGGNFIELYQKAGQAFGINPKLLQAVHIVETGARGSTVVTSYAGAQGPMQFMPATFRAYSVDGNGDGVKDINNVDDAVFSAAKYLAANGGATNHRKALWHYNHSEAYINKVLGIATSLGM